MLNNVNLIGNLGSDPELKTLPSGRAVCEFSLATHERWRDKEGELREETQWHRIVTWGKLAETCAKALYKGRLVYVTGSIKNRTYEKDGQKRFTSEVEAYDVRFLDKPDKTRQQVDVQSGNGTSTDDVARSPFG